MQTNGETAYAHQSDYILLGGTIPQINQQI